jgi:hypothetical protein
MAATATTAIDNQKMALFNTLKKVYKNLESGRLSIPAKFHDLPDKYKSDLEAFCTPRLVAPFWPWQYNVWVWQSKNSVEENPVTWLQQQVAECDTLLATVETFDIDFEYFSVDIKFIRKQYQRLVSDAKALLINNN